MLTFLIEYSVLTVSILTWHLPIPPSKRKQLELCEAQYQLIVNRTHVDREMETHALIKFLLKWSESLEPEEFQVYYYETHLSVRVHAHVQLL